MNPMTDQEYFADWTDDRLKTTLTEEQGLLPMYGEGAWRSTVSFVAAIQREIARRSRVDVDTPRAHGGTQ